MNMRRDKGHLHDRNLQKTNYKEKGSSSWEYFPGSLLAYRPLGWLGPAAKGHGYGCIGDIVVGVIGALLGGWIASHFFHMGAPSHPSGINLPSIGVAFVGENDRDHLTPDRWKKGLTLRLFENLGGKWIERVAKIWPSLRLRNCITGHSGG